MLDIEILKQQDGLNGLTDAQFQCIADLSKRDEEIVVPKKFGELLGNLDTIIASKSAIGRNEGEKTSEYLTRVMEQMKSAADEGAGFKTANADLTAQIAKLKEDIAKGAGNEQLKADLEKANAALAAAKKVNGELQESLTKKEAEYKGKLEGYRMDSELGAALAAVTLDKTIPEAAKRAILDAAKMTVRNSKHVFDETAGAFIFQDAEGNPRLDKSLKNLSVADVLMEELSKMGVLDTGRQQGGAGGNGNAGGSGNGSGNGSGAGVSITTAKTKVEADEIIRRELMAQGHATSDADWYKLVHEARVANKAFYDGLPLQ